MLKVVCYYYLSYGTVNIPLHWNEYSKDFINEVKNMSFDHINSFIKGTEKLNDIHDYKSEFSSRGVD